MEETKKKLSGGKIAAIVIASILGVVLIAVGGFAIWLFGAPQPESAKIDYQELHIDMSADASGTVQNYYVGRDGEINLNKAFPDCTEFSGTGVSYDNGIPKIKKPRAGELSYKNKDGKVVEVKLISVDAINLEGTRVEKDMRKALKKGQSVILHQNLETKEGDGFAIADGATLYGNGHELHAASISAPRGADKKSWGTNIFSLHEGTSLNVRDLHIFVNDIKPNDDGKKIVDLEQFLYSGAGFDFNGVVNNDTGEYDTSTITNCIIENGQKLIHLQGANVVVDGCIIRNGADANIAIGTYKEKPSHITIRNSVSSNSMVAGLLFYGWDNIPKGDKQYQNTLNIEGFFDIYNWKSAKAAKLVPATEAPLDTIVNGQVMKEINNPTFAQFMYDYKGEKYVHIGMIRLATGGLTGQNPTVLYNGKPGAKDAETGKPTAGVQKGYKEVDFPLPEWVKKPPLDIVKRCDMIAYDSKADEKDINIKPDSQLVVEGEYAKTIYHDLLFGRAGFPVK